MTPVTRRAFQTSVAASVMGAPAMGGSLFANQRRPNVVFILSDQHIGSFLGASGHPLVRTPNLDRLAARGVNYRNAYCVSPLCGPSRAALMSGRFGSDVEAYCNATAYDGRSGGWTKSLRDAGYHCWATGKLAMSNEADFGLETDHVTYNHWVGPDIACLLRSPVCFLPTARERLDASYKEQEHSDTQLFDRTLTFLRERTPALQKPWAMYLGPHAPHPNWRTKPKYRDIYPPAKMPLPDLPDGYVDRQHPFFRAAANYRNCAVPLPASRIQRTRSVYMGMITELDAQIGRLIDHLERTGQMDNTLFVYTSDHGEMLGEHGLWSKNVLLEYSARVPMLIAGPGLPKGKTVDTPVSHVDLTATVLDLAGVQRSGTLRGHSLAGLARGETTTHPGFAYGESHSDGNMTGSFMIRKGEWKYIYFTADRPLLFNVKNDPGELNDLSEGPEYAEVRKELHAHLTSLVDPDAVTYRAFDEQERRLAAMVRKYSASEFYEEVVDRLGPAQSRVLTRRLYKGRA